MANKMKVKSKGKTKSTVKAKAKMPTKAPNKRTAKSSIKKTTPRKTAIVKRITFTTQEFKLVQQMLTDNACQTLKEWVNKKISEHKLQQSSAST